MEIEVPFCSCISSVNKECRSSLTEASYISELKSLPELTDSFEEFDVQYLVYSVSILSLLVLCSCLFKKSVEAKSLTTDMLI